MSHATASIEIEAPIKKVFEVISDFESYPDFLNETREVVVEKKSGKGARVTFTINLIKKIRYTLDIKLNPPSGLSWTLVEGDLMKANNGGWKLSEVKKGITQAVYEIDMDLGSMVPKAISNKLIGTNLPTMMKQFKERAEELA
ncbi:MAG: SRPBCC family protein [Deltaproteobacteria bacterium]|nr:SRPBCC family protein [Deltaproteobacteria bacterium]